MLCFTKVNMLYAVLVCFFFGVTVGAYVFVSRADQMCPTYMNDGSVGLCYVAIGAGAAGIAGISWSFLPIPMRVYVSLMATMTGGHVFNIQMTILLYIETMRVISHIQRVMVVPLEVAECLKEETVYSVRLIQRSLFGKSNVDEMNHGIKEVAASFDRAREAQDKFRASIEGGFMWLENKGSMCTTTFQNASRPSQTCPETSTEYQCQAMRKLEPSSCNIFSEDRITEQLSSIRSRIAGWISSAIRMRVGIFFSMSQTNNIHQELVNAWAPFKKLMNNGADFMDSVRNFVTMYVLKYMGAFILILWPVGYAMGYNRGSLKFDNQYIPEEELEKGHNETDGDTNDELRFLPLQLGIETDTIQMVPAWIPTGTEVVRGITYLIFVIDLLTILSLLFLDFYYTRLMDQMYFGSINLFNRFQGNIFDISKKPLSEAKGMHYIGQLILQQLDRLQQAVGLSRFIACGRRPPPIDYSYGIFILAAVIRLYYILSQIKLSWLPSMICARYNKRRHIQRMRCLKARTLLRREEYLQQSQFPWLESFFRSFYTMMDCVPSGVRAFITARDTYNI